MPGFEDEMEAWVASDLAANIAAVGGDQSARALIEAIAATLEPIALTPPTVTGIAVTGEVLTASHGTYTTTPTNYTYRWLSDGSAIAGAVAMSYTLKAQDAGKAVRFEETPINLIGSGVVNLSTAVTPISNDEDTLYTVPYLKGTNYTGFTSGAGSQSPLPAATNYYITQKGMNFIRICFDWKFIQPTLNGALDSASVTLITEQIDRITAAGGYAVVEIHNYGRLTISGTEYIIGEAAQVPASAFADLWRRMALEWMNNDKVIFELMNEPHDINAATWTQTQNLAVAAIRETGARNKVLFAAAAWNATGIVAGPIRNAMLDVVDPLDPNPTFDIHHYFDPYSAGSVATIIPQPIAAIESVTTFLRANGLTAMCLEFAAAQLYAGYQAMRALLDHFEANQDVWKGWAYWGAGGWWQYDYLFLIDPYGTKWPNSGKEHDFTTPAITWAAPRIDRPQMAVLEEYLDTTPIVNRISRSRELTAHTGITGPWTHSNMTVTAGTVGTPLTGTSNGIFGPGSLFSLVENTTNGEHLIRQDNITIVSGQDFTYSTIVRAGSSTQVTLRALSSDWAHGIAAVVNIPLNGTGSISYTYPTGSGVVTASSITHLGGGLYAITLTGTLPATSARLGLYARSADSDTYTGVNGRVALYVDTFGVAAGTTATYRVTGTDLTPLQPPAEAFDIHTLTTGNYYGPESYVVGTWTDTIQGANGTQTTTAAQPTVSTDGDGATFTSTQKLNATGVSTSQNDISVFAVVTIPSLAGSNKTVLGSSGGGGLQLQVNTSGTIFINRQGVGNKAASPTGFIPENTKVLVEVIARTSTEIKSKFGKNGVVTDTTWATNNDAFTAARTAVIGGRDSGENFVGTIHALFVIPGEPSLSIRQKIEGYMMWDCGIQALLPDEHPYKTTNPKA